MNQSELKRVLSNLINNAVEAYENAAGTIVVSVRFNNTGATPRTISIIIRDDGKGMPKHIVDKIGTRGVSYGKTGTQSGSGLGLYHAIGVVESFNGNLVIDSALNEGTTITILLPQSSPPEWFLESINVARGTTIVIVDDDNFICTAWREKFANITTGNINTFSKIEEFKKWCSGKSNVSPTLYLIDYEFIAERKSGLDLIAEYGIGNQSILVTSRYQEQEIQLLCQRSGIKLLPKNMMTEVPVRVT